MEYVCGQQVKLARRVEIKGKHGMHHACLPFKPLHKTTNHQQVPSIKVNLVILRAFERIQRRSPPTHQGILIDYILPVLSFHKWTENSRELWIWAFYLVKNVRTNTFYLWYDNIIEILLPPLRPV